VITALFEALNFLVPGCLTFAMMAHLMPGPHRTLPYPLCPHPPLPGRRSWDWVVGLFGTLVLLARKFDFFEHIVCASNFGTVISGCDVFRHPPDRFNKSFYARNEPRTFVSITPDRSKLMVFFASKDTVFAIPNFGERDFGPYFFHVNLIQFVNFRYPCVWIFSHPFRSF